MTVKREPYQNQHVAGIFVADALTWIGGILLLLSHDPFRRQLGGLHGVVLRVEQQHRATDISHFDLCPPFDA